MVNKSSNQSKNSKILSPLRADPTRCLTLRRQFTTKLKTNLAQIREAILSSASTIPSYLSDLSRTELLSRTLEEVVWTAKDSIKPVISKFVADGLMRGMLRAYDDSVKIRKRTAANSIGTYRNQSGTTYQPSIISFPQENPAGGRGQFVAAMLRNSPYTQQHTLLVNQVLRDWQLIIDSLINSILGVTSSIEIILAFSLPTTIRKLTALATTSITRSHAEGQLLAYAALGVTSLSLNPEVKFTTAGDGKVCQECKALEGEKFTVEQARGVIPVHPYCFCSWQVSTS